MPVEKATASRTVRKILPVLSKKYPVARTALRFADPLQLLVATILSAQCTDKKVNEVSSVIFKKYKSASDWAKADIRTLESDIRPTGFYRNKAANIKAACAVIAERHAGMVPDTMDQLVKLPGVGRKTACVVLGNAFGVPAIPCDTHVIRLSRRLGLSDKQDPVKLEFDLAEIVPKKDWIAFSHLLIFHGRNTCKARRPDCENCLIAGYCPAAGRPDLW